MRMTLEFLIGNNGGKLWTELNKVKTGPTMNTDSMKDGFFTSSEISEFL
jgi:hypothetical protein